MVDGEAATVSEAEAEEGMWEAVVEGVILGAEKEDTSA